MSNSPFTVIMRIYIFNRVFFTVGATRRSRILRLASAPPITRERRGILGIHPKPNQPFPVLLGREAKATTFFFGGGVWKIQQNIKCPRWSISPAYYSILFNMYGLEISFEFCFYFDVRPSRTRKFLYIILIDNFLTRCGIIQLISSQVIENMPINPPDRWQQGKNGLHSQKTIIILYVGRSNWTLS